MKQAYTITRRAALAGLAALSGGLVPAGHASQLTPLSDTDRRILALANELTTREAEISHTMDIAEARYGADPERTPLAGHFAELQQDARQLIDALAETSADSVQALAAKLTATRPFRSPDPGLGYDRIEWMALHEIERLGGVV